jgi:hypothetical protein
VNDSLLLTFSMNIPAGNMDRNAVDLFYPSVFHYIVTTELRKGASTASMLAERSEIYQEHLSLETTHHRSLGGSETISDNICSF